MSIDDRKFTDEEVREILARAVERAPARALARGDGLSLEEIKSIGREVGIDPDRIADAARSVTLAGAHAAKPLLGGPTTLRFERKIAGELTPEDTPEVLALIRREMGHQGKLEQLHGTLDWSVENETGSRYVTISSRDGMTTITGSSNLAASVALTFMPLGVVGMVMTIVGLARWAKSGEELMMILAIAVVAVLYPVLRTHYGKRSARESESLQRTIDELARLATGDLSPPTPAADTEER